MAHSSARLAHVGIAVPSLTEALRFYRDVLGLEPAGGPETADGAVIVTLPFGDTSVELLEPRDPNSPGGRRIAFLHPKATAGILLELTE